MFSYFRKKTIEQKIIVKIGEVYKRADGKQTCPIVANTSGDIDYFPFYDPKYRVIYNEYGKTFDSAIDPRRVLVAVVNVEKDRRETVSECNQILAKQGKPYPRTCAKCGLGQCTEMVDNTSVNNLSNNEIDKIAKVCYETIRAYCMSIGDNSHLPWEAAPGWQISTVRKGVKFHIENPNALPSDSHDSWIKEKRKDGWKYGPVKDPEKKEHPCFMLYEDLPKEEQIKDYLFTGVVKAMLSI